MDTKTIDSLPFDVFVEIFQFLPFEDLVSSVQYVNKHWQSIARDPILWRDISFKPSYGLHTYLVTDLLKQAPLLRSFEFREGLKAEKIFETLCEYNPNIVSLAFESFEISNAHMEKLTNTYPNLEYLQLPLTVFVNNITLLGKLRKLKKVKCVQIFYQNGRFSGRSTCSFEETDWCSLDALDLYSEHIDDKFEQMMSHVRGKLLSLEMQTVFTSSFLRHIPHCLNLERLKLNFMSRHIRNPDLVEFLVGLKSLVNLKYLNLTSFVHTDDDVLCKFFQKASYPKLTELNFGHCLNFNHRVAVDIVSSCRQLEVISLKGCVSLDDACVLEFSRLPRLSTLDISGCPGVTEAGLALLPGCQRFKELNISWNGLVSVPMLEHIANMKELKILRLDHTELNLVHLVAATRKLEHLQLLSVYRARGVDGEQLQEMLPRCFIQYSKRDLYSILKEKANSMQVIYINGVSRNVLKVLPEYRNLEELSVDFLEKPSYQFAETFAAVKAFGKLQKLSLRGFVPTEEGQLSDILGGEGLGQLRELGLEHCLSVDHDVAEFIAKHHPQLEKLSLRGCVGLSNNGLSSIVKIEGLSVLDISGCCSLSEAGLLHLKQCKNLTELNLCGLLTENVLADVLNYVLSLPKLCILTLETDELVEKFMENKNWAISPKLREGKRASFVRSALAVE